MSDQPAPPAITAPAPQPDLTAVMGMMAQMMQQMQAQQEQMMDQADTIARMQAQAVIDAANRADQLKAEAAAAAAQVAAAAAQKHGKWWEVGHFAVAIAPAVITGLSIYNGQPISPRAMALYQLSNQVVAPYFGINPNPPVTAP